MDFDSVNAKMKKFALSAATALNRAVQYTEEKLGQAEKTELDAHFENLLQRSEKTRQWTEKLLRSSETLLQPNPNIRMEDFLYEKVDKKKRDRYTNAEQLGQVMIDSGNDYGPGTAYGNSLIKCGQTHMQIGNAEKEFVQTACNNFLSPLKNFLEGDMRTITKEKKVLETKRLDLDACKSRVRKAKSQAGNQQPDPYMNPVLVEDDAVAKAEADLRVAQSEFDRQVEITKLLLEGISSTHAHHLRCINDFIESEMNYYAQCHQYMLDLRKQLGGLSSFISCAPRSIFAPSATELGNNSNAGAQPQLASLSTFYPNPSAPPAIEVTAPSPNVEKKYARVLYDYAAADLTEISLTADELITVHSLPSLGDDYVMAEKGHNRGKVPVNYLQILN
ncbi:endophilin-B1 isoform X4 [Octopus vulgaris]|uniref:Endophilin-B1 isoform X4 n=1 Tax=Octopus vulgaris TaxID=6645 RepID=A0AA36F081_OCTVU|nr:endophilin-B1 isoform X4 [Octopus vulgaris]